MFAPPQEIPLQLHARVPAHLRLEDRVSWMARRRPGMRIGAFLEGPSFDRGGNLWLVDLAHGRLLRISPAGVWDVVLEYDGQPNGLAIHKDGSVWIADHRKGILKFDPASGQLTTVLSELPNAKLKGPNDLMFAENGDLYFTDQGSTGLHDPTGRLVRIRAAGAVEVLVDNVPSPNGLVVQRDMRAVFLAVTRDNAVWYVPLLGEDREEVGRVGRFIQMQGGAGGGPDGMAMDAEGNLVVAHVMLGSVWIFSALGEPLYRLRSSAGPLITNAAFGGPDGKTLFVTESSTGSLLSVRLPVAGMPLYSHM